MSKPNVGELIFFWILFGIVGLLAFAVMSPYFTLLFLAAVFTVLFSPLYQRFLLWTKGRKSLASFCTVTLVLLVILVPLIFLGTMLFQEVIGIYGSLSGEAGYIAVLDNATRSFEQYVNKLIPSFRIDTNISDYLEGALRWVAGNLNNVFSGIVAVFFNMVLIIVAMFFFYRDGHRLHDFALKWSPLSDKYDESIIAKVELAIASVVKGALTTAIVQGVLVGVGFAIVGISNPVLWGTIATVAALIPVLGTGIITVPAGVALLIYGHIWGGAFLLLWAFLVVGLVDNVLRPYVIQRGVDIHPFLVLLSVFGGIAYFGPVGFLAGPVVLAFFFAMLDIYPQIVRGRSIKEEAQ